jgi:hypothetical protein
VWEQTKSAAAELAAVLFAPKQSDRQHKKHGPRSPESRKHLKLRKTKSVSSTKPRSNCAAAIRARMDHDATSRQTLFCTPTFWSSNPMLSSS